MVSNLWDTLVSVHANAGITAWTFIREHFTVFLVGFVILYLFREEVKTYEHEFIQDERKIL